jgi:hypothetical protein
MDLRGIEQSQYVNSALYAGKLQSQYSRFYGLEAAPIPVSNQKGIVSYSNFSVPINKNPKQLSGYGRGAGQASYETQREVMQAIIKHSQHHSLEDRALLLSIAKLESGFNPDAAAISSSASGVFQLIKTTASNLGVSQAEVFDADKNIQAGIKLFEENAFLVQQKYSFLRGNERAVMIYALHHDGPALNSGGAAIARERILPELPKFEAVLARASGFDF